MPRKRTLFHFFSSKCPFSKFNIKEFERLAKEYQKDINFYVIIQSDDNEELSNFRNKYDLNLPTVLDKRGIISDICGVYATLQAVIIDENSNLFYKGNYKKARFCTRKETRYVDVAIKYLLTGKQMPLLEVAFSMYKPYGCTLSSDEEHHSKEKIRLLSIFN